MCSITWNVGTILGHLSRILQSYHLIALFATFILVLWHLSFRFKLRVLVTRMMVVF